jgi:hypothetical protein
VGGAEGPAPSKAETGKGTDYDRLYGGEPPRRRVGRVERDRVDVDVGTAAEEESIVPDGPYEVPEPPASVAGAAEEVEEPTPLPSWMSQGERVAEPEAEPPTAAPEPSEPSWTGREREESPYRYRRTAGDDLRYRGAGPPRR